MAAIPLGFILGLIGIAVDKRKTPAALGLALTGGLILMFLYAQFC